MFRIQANNSIMRGYFWIRFIDFMFAGKTLINYTNLFPTYDFEKSDNDSHNIKMIEATNVYSNLSNQTKCRLNEINKIKDYFLRQKFKKEK